MQISKTENGRVTLTHKHLLRFLLGFDLSNLPVPRFDPIWWHLMVKLNFATNVHNNPWFSSWSYNILFFLGCWCWPWLNTFTISSQRRKLQGNPALTSRSCLWYIMTLWSTRQKKLWEQFKMCPRSPSLFFSHKFYLPLSSEGKWSMVYMFSLCRKDSNVSEGIMFAIVSRYVRTKRSASVSAKRWPKTERQTWNELAMSK